ncbi:Copper homeostasis protein cutC [Araneus ventricosus]|uniref:Copper homeostasis protein cutC homolog n=1 Tax=Araneus ventricosus TaxID=182803 RepID=A0A4Y2ATQ9_ARAVE|nr:Copper homeostasis protein cutC [Araneus ventricosus]
MDLKLEICIESITSALAAEEGGADRIELCQALEVGGVTPSIGLMKMVKKLLKIPVFMLVRPRAGNFVYSPEEISFMEEDIRTGVNLGIDGFVTGALRTNGRIDKEACSRLIGAANGLPVTFHRAFDMSISNQPLQEIIDLGFQRILTSGRCSTAHEGMLSIKTLIEEANSRIIIMPGSGISPLNLQEIMETTGAVEFHSSGQCKDLTPLAHEAVVKGATFSPLTSADIVKKMKSILKS